MRAGGNRLESARGRAPAVIQTFSVGDYRGIGGLAVEGLRRVNLVTGPNGVGKTALLEALWAFHGRFLPSNLWNQHIQRTKRGSLDPVAALAHDRVDLVGTEDGTPRAAKFAFELGAAPPATSGNGPDDGNGGARPMVVSGGTPAGVPMTPIRIDGRLRLWLDGEEVHEPLQPFRTGNGLVLVPLPAPTEPRPNGIIDLPAMAFDPSEDTINHYSRILRRGAKEDLKERLRLILPLVEDMEIVTSDDGAPYLMATTDDGERMALQALGGGMMRLFRTYTHFFSASGGGVLLLDEVENGLHHSVLERLWTDIREMASALDVQVFATTHSIECVRAAVEAFADTWSDLAVIGVYRPRDEEGARAVMYADDRLRAATDNGMELR